MELLHVAPDRRVKPYQGKIKCMVLSKERMSEEEFANTIPSCYIDSYFHIRRMISDHGITSIYGYQYSRKSIGVIEWDDGSLMVFDMNKTITGFEIELHDPIDEDENNNIEFILPIDYSIV